VTAGEGAGQLPMPDAIAQKRFIEAATDDNLDVMRQAVAAGADPNHDNYRMFCWATLNGKYETFDLLLSFGAPFDHGENRPIRFAAANKDSRVLERLIKMGADVHANENEAIRRATRYAYAANVALLLNAGADPLQTPTAQRDVRRPPPRDARHPFDASAYEIAKADTSGMSTEIVAMIEAWQAMLALKTEGADARLLCASLTAAPSSRAGGL